MKQMGSCHFRVAIGAVSQADPIGPKAVLPGSVFDPLDIPFLPNWPEPPAVFPRPESKRGDDTWKEEPFPNPAKVLSRLR